MNRINGLPSQVTPLPKSGRKPQAAVQPAADERGTQVTTVKSTPVRMASEEQINQSRVQYDLPEGSARQAMQEYLKVADHARREQLEQLVGVDLYI